MSGEKVSLTVETEGNVRLDKYLADVLEGQSRSGVQRLMEEGHVFLSGKPAAKNAKVQTGDWVEVLIPPPASLDVEAQDIPLDIVYEDDDLLVVNKPKGMVVHPAAGNPDGTLVNALLYHCKDSLSGIGGVLRPGIVHRIDKDTSGLLMVAKNDFAHLSLAQQIKDHSFTRIYAAVVYGNIKEESGTVNAPIGRHPTDRKKMCVTEKNSREAVTHFEVVERLRGFTQLKVRLETGRTHQIRVHMAYLGHPVAGDPVYGPKKVIRSLGGQCLHAQTLGFVHPRTGEYLEFTAPPPDSFVSFVHSVSV
ncbi:RluA family pseudouridine synthase [Zongyangia hominis]|uniref:Pseudouridine synthase n=1 Tax=Zongyangia hominis TaxID=2763677 RepID=A0A926ECJ6_9FIRM|nr:RluA family pseudouridine synthase [Zongyangia hominis]MBC8569631.1 RluA family pseudouridine synthase [Zongyangia hominis]